MCVYVCVCVCVCVCVHGHGCVGVGVGVSTAVGLLEQGFLIAVAFIVKWKWRDCCL